MKGVSPVIGVILMVAITVVLASTVYYMMSTFGGTEPESLRIGGLQAIEEDYDAGTVKFIFGPFTPETKPTDLRIVIQEKGDREMLGMVYNSNTGFYENSESNFTAQYVDPLENGVVNRGDYVLAEPFVRGDYYTITIIDEKTKDVIYEKTFKM